MHRLTGSRLNPRTSTKHEGGGEKLKLPSIKVLDEITPFGKTPDGRSKFVLMDNLVYRVTDRNRILVGDRIEFDHKVGVGAIEFQPV